jgi:hypothetical protein
LLTKGLNYPRGTADKVQVSLAAHAVVKLRGLRGLYYASGEPWDAITLESVSRPSRPARNYLPLVKYNGERIWARLPEGVELDDLISAGVFG